MPDAPNEYEAALEGFAIPSGDDPDHGRDELERLASALAAQVRAGAASDVAGVADGRPDLEGRLREIAPVIEALERWKVLKAAEVGLGELPAALGIDRLGDCRLGREIGRGGNAIVVAAVQGTIWRRRVAVKVFPWRTAADGDEGRRRFLDEASTLARLQHRHIVPIYSFGSESGHSYYVMRIAEGGSLDRVIGRLKNPGRDVSDPAEAMRSFGRGDWRRIADLGAQVAEALAYAHANGVVHGDVKPANVLLDAAGRALVTDFGPSERSVPDGGNRLAGTYRYMAPERFDGVCDERGDVYSLGATLYECATLAPAFEADGRDSLFRSIQRYEVVAARLVRPDLPGDLDSVIGKAMARDPADRYRSAENLAADLRNFLRGRRTVAGRPAKRGSPFARLFRGRGT